MTNRYSLIFRLVAMILLIILASKPVMVRPEARLPTNWAVLIDASASMRVKDPIERLDRVKRSVHELLKKANGMSLFKFSDTAERLKNDDVESLKPVGKLSDMANALRESLSGRQYKGAILFSDGREVGKDDAVAMAASLGRPLFLVGVGDRALFKDVAVRAVQSPPFAFKNVATSLSATLSVIGYPGTDISVTLREGDRVLSIQKIRVETQEAEATVTFNWTPTSVGTKILTVEAARYSGEVSTLNNQRDVTLDVGRDRFRVLYICGEPGPEYGFLRHQFKADPAVELVTFVILRNASNTVNIPETELSLIPFPTQDVLINQMSTFDLVVFEEFSYQQYGLSPAVIYAVRQKVQDGGSFLIMGGPTAFGPYGGYMLPGIREMIPVEFGGNDVRVAEEAVPFVAKAPTHPILRIEENVERNKDIWRSLPPLEAVTLLPSAKPGASVLGTTNVGGKEYPVLTVWKFGKGRVGALSTRTTWRWSMLNGGAARVSDVYQRFWKNMVLWLTHSDEFKSVRVALQSKVAHIDEKQTVRVWVVDDFFKPLADVDVQLQVTAPNGNKETLKTFSETAGVFAASFKPTMLGAHQIQAWVTRNGKKFGADAMTARVVENLSEEEDLRPNFETLNELARATGGKFLPIDQFTPAAFDEFDRESSKTAGKKILVWNSPWFLLLLLVVFMSEWFFRKRRGLP